MHLAQELKKLKEEIQWELKELQTWLLPHTNKVNQQVHNTVLELQ